MDFSKQIQKAEEAARRRNYDFAVKLYQQLLAIDADQAEARAGLRRVLKRRHEQKKGGGLLRAISGAGPLALARTLRKAGRHEACAKALEGFLETNPLHEDANLMLGMALEDAGHFKSARAVYEFLAEIAPKNPEGLKRAGAMTYRLGDHARALEYYERALEADPRDQDAIKARKDLAAEQALARSSGAGVQHSRDQIRDKDEARRLERAQRLHLSEDELRQELARLEDRLAEAPSDPDLLVRLGEVHEKLKDPEAALDVIERALSYRKDSFELASRAGDLRGKVLKKRLARADAEGDGEGAGRIEEELRRFEVEDARRRVEMRPGDAALRFALGRRLMRVDEYDAAAAELQKAVADPRVRRDAQIALAHCFRAKGFLDLARREYERALGEASGVDDRAKEILYNLGAIAEAENHPDEARGYYARIFEVDIGYRDVAAKMEQFRQT
jgi:tetratricopeptide (TPR) repeat protein